MYASAANRKLVKRKRRRSLLAFHRRDRETMRPMKTKYPTMITHDCDNYIDNQKENDDGRESSSRNKIESLGGIDRTFHDNRGGDCRTAENAGCVDRKTVCQGFALRADTC